MAIENTEYRAKRHPSLDGLAAFVWEKPYIAKTVLTSIANSGLLTPEEVQFSRLTSEEQAKQLCKLGNQNLGILGISVIAWNNAHGVPIIFHVEKGMPEEFQEVLRGAAPGVEIFVREEAPDSPLITSK